VCRQPDPMTSQPLVEVVDRDNDADLATTLVHEYAHAILHFGVEDEPERAKRELEAEAIAYLVGRHSKEVCQRLAMKLVVQPVIIEEQEMRREDK